MKAQTRSPEFTAQAANVRSMGDADIRKAAETSNRLLQTPVRALQEGGIAQGSKVGNTLLELRRTVEDLDPSQATGTRKFLGMIPFGDKIVDYFRRYEAAQSHLNGILHALRNGQDELTKDNVALNMEKQNLWGAMGRLNPYIYIAERLDAQLRAAIAELEFSDPERGQGAQPGRVVLRPAEAPGPAHPARGVDPELPGHRHHHQEQHRADQGRRPRVHDDGLGAADRGDRGPGARQPEAGARPDHRPEHHHLGPDPAHLGDAPRQLRRRSSSRPRRRPSGCRSCRPRSRTSTPRWTRSTPSSCRRWTPWRPRSAPWSPRWPSRGSTSTGCSGRTTGSPPVPWTSSDSGPGPGTTGLR